jgi:hypothetical protein
VACEQAKNVIDSTPPSLITAELRRGVTDRIIKINEILNKKVKRP